MGVLVALGVIGAGGIAVASATLRGGAAPAGRLETLAVATAPVLFEEAHARERDFIGRVEPARAAALGFEIRGRLVEVLVDAGDRVAAGQPLVRLDVARLEARRSELTADLARVEADLELGRITKARLGRLIGEGAASQQALDDAREGLRALTAAVRLARARLASNAVELEKSVISAPFDAIVTARRRDEGSVVESGEPVLEVLELAAHEARVGIAGPLVGQLARGERVQVSVQGDPVGASVKAVLPVRSLGTRTVDVILTLDAPVHAVRSGDLVRLRLAEPVPGDGLWLPIAALAEGRRGLWTASVAVPLAAGELGPPGGPTHRVSRRTVEVVHMSEERAFVRGPLADGERVLTSGVHRVVPGQRVRLAGTRDDG